MLAWSGLFYRAAVSHTFPMRLKTETETASWTMLKHSRAEEPGAVYEWIHQHKQHLSLPTVIWSIVIIGKLMTRLDFVTTVAFLCPYNVLIVSWDVLRASKHYVNVGKKQKICKGWRKWAATKKKLRRLVWTSVQTEVWELGWELTSWRLKRWPAVYGCGASAPHGRVGRNSG